MIYYTRDGDGCRALWIEKPSKDEDGEWFCDGFIWALLASDFNGEEHKMDALIGKGFHGLRKGKMAELELNCWWRS